jgi:tetratricopeptide (TPR) repeat protein
MPETARILQFPQSPRQRALSSAEAAAAARCYLDESTGNRSVQFVEDALRDPDVLLAVVSQLRSLIDAAPRVVAVETVAIYEWLLGRDSLGFFDERDYFLGESAAVAAAAFRVLGRRDEAELWLERAEAGFRHTVNPAPALANVSYTRLALHYDAGRYGRALELLPSLTQSFAKLGMEREALKSRFLEAMSLKNSSRATEARIKLEAMAEEVGLPRQNGLYGLVLLNLGDLLAQDGEVQQALPLYRRALPLLKASSQPGAVAHLKGLIGETLRAQGNLSAAVESFRSAITDYLELGAETWVAYLRVVLSETLIALSRNREAEWEILAALPTIEEQKMVPEGFAAIALLRESVTRRKADPSALRELREYLQARN